jgi:hypothetical protein
MKSGVKDLADGSLCLCCVTSFYTNIRNKVKWSNVSIGVALLIIVSWHRFNERLSRCI